jgi:hypothetical protein
MASLYHAFELFPPQKLGVLEIKTGFSRSWIRANELILYPFLLAGIIPTIIRRGVSPELWK